MKSTPDLASLGGGTHPLRHCQSDFAPVNSLESVESNLTELQQSLEAKCQKLSLDRIQHHLFLCADQTEPICCQKEAGLAAWQYLKRRIKELDLETQVFRTKANCLRVCEQGPILAIYPDRVWYHSATAPVLERILQEHVIGGNVVQEFAFVVPTA